MSEPVILIAAKSSGPRLDLLAPLQNQARIVIANSAEANKDEASEATVLFNWSASRDLLRELFLASPNLKWVHSRNAGVDNLLFPELIDSEVVLTNGSGVFSPSLGEFALLAMLYFAKDVPRLNRQKNAKKWEAFDMHPIERKTVGIVGYGDIGREVGLRVKAMGMRVLALKRHMPEPGSNPGPIDKFFVTAELNDMVSECDYVVVAAPLTPETHHLVNEKTFAAMKKDSIIINVGRGPVIDESSMITALREGRIKGAGLDVFEQEPLPSDCPLYEMENVLLSPHTADHHAEWLDDALRFFVAQYERFTKGEPLLNVVNKQLGY